MLGRKATRIYVAAAGMEKFFPADRIRVTGNPVRRSIEESSVTREAGIRFFQLDPARTTVLAVGGSLGAKSINEALRKDLAMFGNAGMQLIWQTGKPFEAEGKHAAEGKANVWCGPFITQMEQAYAAADIVISRAGAMAIAELCITGKPAVLVPFPHAAEDHQTHNARQLADKGAGIMVTDAEAAGKLVAQVIDLSRNEERRRTLSENIRKLAIGRADEVIAGSILAELEKEKV